MRDYDSKEVATVRLVFDLLIALERRIEMDQSRRAGILAEKGAKDDHDLSDPAARLAERVPQPRTGFRGVSPATPRTEPAFSRSEILIKLEEIPERVGGDEAVGVLLGVDPMGVMVG